MILTYHTNVCDHPRSYHPPNSEFSAECVSRSAMDKLDHGAALGDRDVISLDIVSNKTWNPLNVIENINTLLAFVVVHQLSLGYIRLLFLKVNPRINAGSQLDPCTVSDSQQCHLRYQPI